MDTLPHTPILIVGGGPVGLTLSIELGIRGVPCTVVNEGKTIPEHPRGSTHNARTMEHFRRLGVAQAVRKAGLPPDHATDVAYVTRVTGHELVRFQMPSAAEKTRPGSPHMALTPEPLHRVNQMYAEPILKDHAESFPSVTTRFGWQLTGFTQHADHVEATIMDVGTGKEKTLTCGYLIGADGGQSTVRRALGIAYHGKGGEDIDFMMGRMQSTYIEAPEIYNLLKISKAFHYTTINRDARAVVITLDGQGKFLVLSKRSADEGEEISEEKTRRIVQAAVGHQVPVKIISAKPWLAGQALVADRYGEERVLLTGDAVHLFTPSGGFGMNTGIDDAANLGWKLAAWHQGWGGPALMDTYEIERRPIGLRNTGESRKLAEDFSGISIPEELEDDSPEGARARDVLREHLVGFKEKYGSLGVQLGARYDVSPIIAGDGTVPPPDDPKVYVPTACPGGRAPHLWRKDGSALFDHFGMGFTLLRFDRSCDTTKVAGAAHLRNVPLKVVDVEEPEGRERYEANLALIRPDQHVAWRGDEAPSDPLVLIDCATGNGPAS